MIIVMLDDTSLTTKFLLTNPTDEAFNLAWILFSQQGPRSKILSGGAKRECVIISQLGGEGGGGGGVRVRRHATLRKFGF